MRHLAEHGSSSVINIHSALAKLNRRPVKGIPAIYKALRNLSKNQVVVHRHGSYQLSHTWLFDVAELIENALNSPLNDQSATSLPSLGGQFSWRYSDLRTLNVFASHLITSIAYTTPGATLYAWSPHPWFNLAHHNHERVYQQTLKKHQIKSHRIIGGDYPLDHAVINSIRADISKVRFIGDRSFLSRQHYVVLIGNYIITMRVARNTAEAIDALFMRTKSIDTIDVRLFQGIFKHMRDSALLQIENNPDKFKKLSQKFQTYLHE